MEDLKMYITIKKPNDTDANAIGVNFPCEHKELSRICNELGIEETTGKNCCIVNAMDGNFIGMVKENYCNVVELNFLINLTYNTHCYSVIKNFNKLHEEGREIYLNERIGASTQD